MEALIESQAARTMERKKGQLPASDAVGSLQIEVYQEAENRWLQYAQTRSSDTGYESRVYSEIQSELAPWMQDVDLTSTDLLSEKLPVLAISIDALNAALDQTFKSMDSSINPVSRKRPATMPIPQLMLESVIDRDSLVEVALDFQRNYVGRHVAWNEPSDKVPRIHLGDARDYLRSGLEGAYRLLAHPRNRHLLCSTIESGLADKIKLGQTAEIAVLRQQFYQALAGELGSGNHFVLADDVPGQQLGPSPPTAVRNLAWVVIVEMALLNDRLNEDVHNIRLTRGDCGCHPTRKFAYYLPMPASHEAELADAEFLAATAEFQEYVRCRWPIHVFHVDPVVEDQNVRESSLLQRELAVAAAVGLASGRLNFLQANQFVRAYQEQIDTVQLHRTINGFSHGNDTFGWRFQPRIQTHANRGNLAAFGESLLGRSADANLRDLAIEPGMRECTAIVLMPSFVPYCDFEVSTNWYRLDNPRSTELTTHASMKLSRSVRQMQDNANLCAQVSHLYREGEVSRLLNRVGQLEQELPFQSLRVQIPHENTLGGFELFSNGVTDFAPELVGWYGAPGVVLGGDGCCPEHCQQAGDSAEEEDAAQSTTCTCEGETIGKGTTLFIVGNSFSVHETQVIAGGVAIPREHVKMISRQVVAVTIPRCVATIQFDGRTYVDVHAATPYGVTNHLHVPAIQSAAAATESATAAALEQAAENLKAIEERLKRVEQLNTAFQWAVPSTLEVTTSFEDTSRLRKEPVPEGQAQTPRVHVNLNAPRNGQPFVLSWTHGGSFPSNGIGQAVGGRARIAGQFLRGGKPVGTSFWFAGDHAVQLYQASKLELTAEQLLEALREAIKTQLTLDATGNDDVIDLEIQTWVVPTQFVDNGAGQTVEQAVDQPRPVTTRIPLKINRRVLPPNSQQLPQPISLPDQLPGSTGAVLPAPRK